jgi:hypothetical protein
MIHRGLFVETPRQGVQAIRPLGLITVFLFVFLELLWPISVQAQSLEVKDLVLDQGSGQVQVRFGLVVNGVDELRRILEEGGVFELKCQATLYKKRGVVWDAAMGQATFASQINANPLSQSFSVVDSASSKIMQNKNLSELLQHVWKAIAMDLGPVDKLEKGRDYRVVLTVGIEQVDVPQWVKRSMFFWSFEAIPKTSMELPFTN